MLISKQVTLVRVSFLPLTIVIWDDLKKVIWWTQFQLVLKIIGEQWKRENLCFNCGIFNATEITWTMPQKQ